MVTCVSLPTKGTGRKEECLQTFPTLCCFINLNLTTTLRSMTAVCPHSEKRKSAKCMGSRFRTSTKCFPNARYLFFSDVEAV